MLDVGSQLICSDFGGSPLTERLTYEKWVQRLCALADHRWNPMNHVSEWSTPELVIHSGRGDFERKRG
jgi:hypothetical protein